MTFIEKTWHFSRGHDIYRKDVTFIEKTRHLLKRHHIYRKDTTFIEQTHHLSKGHLIYRKDTSFIEKTSHLSKRHLIYHVFAQLKTPHATFEKTLGFAWPPPSKFETEKFKSPLGEAILTVTSWRTRGCARHRHSSSVNRLTHLKRRGSTKHDFSDNLFCHPPWFARP